MTIHELNAALRAEGNVGPEEVMLAVMETNGHITVIPEKHPPTDQPPAAGK